MTVRATRPSSAIRQRMVDFEQKLKRDVAMTAKQREMWSALNRFISRNGGWLVSHANEKDIRVQIRPESELADQLHDLGYDLHPSGTAEKIWGGKILPVNIFTFRIPLPR